MKKQFRDPLSCSSDEQTDSIILIGRSSNIYENTELAKYTNSEACLVPWFNNDSLKIDRYDARHLLDTLETIHKFNYVSVIEDISKDQLDEERYLFLKENSEEFDDKEASDNGTNDHHYVAIPFTYKEELKETSSEEGGDVKASGHENSDAFEPHFEVPNNLLQSLPPTKKLGAIIARTAKFVASHGGQSEIVLRVKQADNPFFNFLMPENDLHPYFRFLVENPHLTEEVKKEEKNEKVEESKPKNDAISLLGEVYGDVDDEEDVGGKDKEKDKNAPIEDSLEAGISPEEPPEEVKMAITKLVEFVSRNGKQFEEVVKEKDKEEGRFPFIIEGHKWFPFYSQKLNSALSQIRLTHKQKAPWRKNFIRGDFSSNPKREVVKCESISGESGGQIDGFPGKNSDNSKEKVELRREENEPEIREEIESFSAHLTKDEESNLNDFGPRRSITDIASLLTKATRINEAEEKEESKNDWKEKDVKEIIETVKQVSEVIKKSSEEKSAESSQLANEEQKKAERLRKAKLLASLLSSSKKESNVPVNSSPKKLEKPLESQQNETIKSTSNLSGILKNGVKMVPNRSLLSEENDLPFTDDEYEKKEEKQKATETSANPELKNLLSVVEKKFGGKKKNLRRKLRDWNDDENQEGEKMGPGDTQTKGKEFENEGKPEEGELSPNTVSVGKPEGMYVVNHQMQQNYKMASDVNSTKRLSHDSFKKKREAYDDYDRWRPS